MIEFITGMIVATIVILPASVLGTYYGIKKGFTNNIKYNKKCPICGKPVGDN